MEMDFSPGLSCRANFPSRSVITPVPAFPFTVAPMSGSPLASVMTPVIFLAFCADTASDMHNIPAVRIAFIFFISTVLL